MLKNVNPGQTSLQSDHKSNSSCTYMYLLRRCCSSEPIFFKSGATFHSVIAWTSFFIKTISYAKNIGLFQAKILFYGIQCVKKTFHLLEYDTLNNFKNLKLIIDLSAYISVLGFMVINYYVSACFAFLSFVSLAFVYVHNLESNDEKS